MMKRSFQQALSRRTRQQCLALNRNLITTIKSQARVSPLVGLRHFSVSSDLQERGILDERGLLVFDTLHELQKNACEAFSNNNIFGTYTTKNEEQNGGEFEWMTYEDFGKKVDQCRSVLKDIGVEEFSKVGIISNNRWEWAAVASAAFSLNATVVPMYEAQMPSDWKYILNDSEASVLICATEDIFGRAMNEVLPSTPLVKSVLCLDSPLGEAHSFATAVANVSGHESSVIKPTPGDLANLIYTSGTTGKPKGVELLHSNFVSNVKGASRSHVEDPHDFVRESDVTLAFLPWAHSYGQTCELWAGITGGSSAGLCRGVPHILEDLQMVKPTVLFAVPTLYKKVYDGVNNLMESASPLRRGLMKRAFALGRRRVEAETAEGPSLGFRERMELSVLDRIVLSKVRDRFGGQLRHGFVAGAACPTEVLDFMDSLGIPICEGYGLTETSPIISRNTPYNRVVGSVGQPLEGITVHIVNPEGESLPDGEEGEICCSGPNVMRGYYRNQEATDEVMTPTPDGKSMMFRTGDLGKIVGDGYVKVTGRLKEQYKLENGKYIVPTPIEESITLSRFITQVVVCGANRPFNVALVVPDWAIIRQELELGNEVPEAHLINDPRVQELIDTEIKATCYKLKKFEIPQKWAAVAPFTAANNMLTPKMSIRRHRVIRTYEDVIAHLYGDEPAVSESTDGYHHDSVAA